MKTLAKYLPYILALGLFFAGRWTSPKPDKDLLQKYESERVELQAEIKAKEDKIVLLSRAERFIEAKRFEDSLRFSERLYSKDLAFSKLKKEYEKINLSRASVAELDSLRAGIISLFAPK